MMRSPARVPPMRRMAAAALPLLLAAAAAAPARQPQRWAVIVGVNDYIDYTADEPGGDLLGAVNDARSMHDVLVARYAFPRDHILLLLDTVATRAAIRSALTEWLPARVQQGDVAVFYFAGHGSLAVDELDGGDEADGLDETICPADVMRNASTNDIRDDELRAWLMGVPTSQRVVILDSCHSGTATRAVAGMRPRTLQRTAPLQRTATRGGSGDVTESMVDGGEIIELAAAAPDQSAMDATFTTDNGAMVNGGAFTTHFVRKLWQAPPTASYRDLFTHTVAALKSERFAQDPQLSGPAQRALFSPASASATQAAAPAPVSTTPAPAVVNAAPVTTTTGAVPISMPGEVVVAAVNGSRVTVQGGANRGYVTGTVLQAASGARVRLEDVAMSTSHGTVVRGTVAPGDHVRLAEVALAAPRLRVDASAVDAALRTALVAALNEAEIAVDAVGGAAADAYLLQDRAAGTLRLLGRDGAERATFSATAAAVAGTLAPMLRSELAIARLAKLENPGSAFQLSVALTSDRTRFRIGDEISFRVKTERAGYLTLVDLAPDGSLTVLYPNPFMQLGELRAGQEIVVPGDAAVFQVSAPAGTGVVRAFITPRPLTLGAPTGEMLSSADGAALAARVRDELQAATRMDAGWSTAIVVYTVER